MPIRHPAALLVPLVACHVPAPGEDRAPDTARALLERSIRHHDPAGSWGRVEVPLRWTATGPGGEVRYVFDVELGPGGDVSMRGTRDGYELDYRVSKDVARVRVDGRDEVPDEVRTALHVDRDGGLFWRDYLGFLAGLPMGLDGPDVELDPEIRRAELEGREVLALRARFAPEVGTDVWTLYLDPGTAALVGCRFDRADPTRDGETLVFEGTCEVAGLRLPAVRRWYGNADRRYLGADELSAPER